jgi:acetyl-CoA carboxylase biotin carboxyl carrier protein
VDVLQSEDIEAIEAVIATLRDTPHLTEIELRQGDRSLTLKRPIPLPTRAATSPSSVAETAIHRPGVTETALVGVGAVDSPPEFTTVTAHLVGIFRAHRPHPVVSGDWVKDRQTLGQLESMRLMNECTAPVAGQIVAVRVQDGQPVEYGQPLFEILPDAAPE